jgi:hypothetical protein
VGLSVREGLVSLVDRENLVVQGHLEVLDFLGVLGVLGVRVENYRRPRSPVGRSWDPPELPGSVLRDSLQQFPLEISPRELSGRQSGSY